LTDSSKPLRTIPAPWRRSSKNCALEKRVAALEGGEELLVEKTRATAAVAASSAVTQHLVDMSRRIGALEAGQGGQRRIE